MRYEMRQLDNGWAVWDAKANTPAVVANCWQTSLTRNDADDLTDLLNWFEGGGEKTLQNFPWK
jgi:hypothetical protein